MSPNQQAEIQESDQLPQQLEAGVVPPVVTVRNSIVKTVADDKNTSSPNRQTQLEQNAGTLSPTAAPVASIETLTCTVSVILLQAWWRGELGRAVADTREDELEAELIQQVIYIENQDEIEQVHEATASSNHSSRTRSAIIVQRCCRRWVSRLKTRALGQQALRHVLDQQAEAEAAEEAEVEVEAEFFVAAEDIQRVWRGEVVRCHVQAELEVESEDALSVLQEAARALQARPKQWVKLRGPITQLTEAMIEMDVNAEFSKLEVEAEATMKAELAEELADEGRSL